MIPRVAVAVDREAVVVTAARPLRVVSSAPLRGGVTTARSVINLHVRRDFAHDKLEPLGAALVSRRGLAAPWTALATAAWTEEARVAWQSARGVTATEVKTSVLAAVGVRCASGEIATGTSTGAVIVAATGRGRVCQFGGPISDLGWVVGRAVRTAMEAGVRRWLEAHPA